MRSVLLAFLGVVFSLWPAAAQTSDQPNIVIILIDDAALMDLGVYGG